jgi:hypothetical protein
MSQRTAQSDFRMLDMVMVMAIVLLGSHHCDPQRENSQMSASNPKFRVLLVKKTLTVENACKEALLLL